MRLRHSHDCAYHGVTYHGHPQAPRGMCLGCGRVEGVAVRHYLGGRHYPSYAPKIIWQRLLHVTIIGPLLGCSCTRCFNHPRRLYYWREGVRDRVRLARLEARVDELERTLRKDVS